MTDELLDELREYLRKNLIIDVQCDRDYLGYAEVRVSLFLENERISESHASVPVSDPDADW